MIVDCAVYREGTRVEVASSLADLPALRQAASPDGFVWLGLHDPSEEEMQRVAEAFGLHRLAVEDALHAVQRPKLEHYDDMVFLVLKTLWYVDELDAVETGQVATFLGDDFVVTVRQGAGLELTSLRHGLEEHSGKLGNGPATVLYAVCDRVVDAYEEVAGELENDVDEVEAAVFSPGRAGESRRIYFLKRELAEVRRAVYPLRAPMQRLALGVVDRVPEGAVHFRDVADHLARVSEVVDTLDSLLSTAFEAHLARISVEQNEDMRRISAWVAIAGVSTLIAGVYGMNFDHMPELGWDLGYAWAIGLMLTASLVLYRLFKRSGWL